MIWLGIRRSTFIMVAFRVLVNKRMQFQSDDDCITCVCKGLLINTFAYEMMANMYEQC